MEISLSDEQIKKLQKIELEMLVEIDRICKANGIKYTLIGGSLLGAVRHQGFIPWDDDADVAMLREEYDKFVEACKIDLDSSRFYFQDMNTTPGYRWGYGKIRRKGTVFVRSGQEHMQYEQGAFVDIFPGDAVPDNVVLEKLHSFHCFCIRKILWSEVGKVTDKSKIMRCWYTMLSKVPEKVIKIHMNKFILYCNKKYKNSEKIRAYLFPVSKYVSGYLREWYTNTEGVLFEGIYLQGSTFRVDYVKCKFGENYMELPPVEKRKIHPVSNIKLIDV